MKILLKSANCSEEMAQVKSPEKAFMGDITMLTSDQMDMQIVLNRLDGLITWTYVDGLGKCIYNSVLAKLKISKREGFDTYAASHQLISKIHNYEYAVNNCNIRGTHTVNNCSSSDGICEY
ncbi:Hypothetical predicted protein [Octopus vulgaris]|uniref:Uncharacterized protein n=1 Tax=Octopus vulgaris TaxID=6645 RepID=A0AA36B5S1_OCTVU|nr:Hypothetical predicted protein [Octopus vulgaris]